MGALITKVGCGEKEYHKYNWEPEGILVRTGYSKPDTRGFHHPNKIDKHHLLRNLLSDTELNTRQ